MSAPSPAKIAPVADTIPTPVVDTVDASIIVAFKGDQERRFTVETWGHLGADHDGWDVKPAKPADLA